MRAIGEAEFFERWREQCAEWKAISDELGMATASAWDISNEQRTRALRDGRTLVTAIEGGFFEVTPGEDRAIAEAANA